MGICANRGSWKSAASVYQVVIDCGIVGIARRVFYIEHAKSRFRFIRGGAELRDLEMYNLFGFLCGR